MRMFGLASWMFLGAVALAACQRQDPGSGKAGVEDGGEADAALEADGGSQCAGKVKFQKQTCQACAEANCCPYIAKCAADPNCILCLGGDKSACPMAEQVVDKLNNCVIALCSMKCGVEPGCDAPQSAPSKGACVTIGATVECNPVTNERCADGEGCDVILQGKGFHCFPGDNTQDICDVCDNQVGPFCKPGMHCAGRCLRYCCDDGDCGTGKCQKGAFLNPIADVVGVCVS